MAAAAPEVVETELDEGFPPAERKVVTQSYDLSVQTLSEQWETGHLLLPDIQRQYVWDNPRASRLVESLLLNIPIPVLYFAETEDAKWEIFDGHQRVRSVTRFLDNEFRLSSLTVLAEHNGRRYHQLPDREQRFLRTRMMRAVVISIDSHPNMKFEIFERLNTGAIVLNAQELRNSLYRGTFNSCLRELVKDDEFRACIGTASPRKRMVDEEFLLRFFALRAGLMDYRPPLKKFLNEYMRGVQSADDETLDELSAVFRSTVKRIRSVWGSNAFKVTDRRGRTSDRTPNRALFDAQMLAFSWLTPRASVTKNRDAIIRAFATLYKDDDFMDSISLATSDRSRTLSRVRAAVGALDAAGLKVSAESPIR